MEIIKHEITKLIAGKGKVLTNGENYADKIILGTLDSPENWHEIPEEEYNKILAEEEKNNNINMEG